MSIVKHPSLGKIECVLSMRARHFRIVLHANGTLRVIHPLFSTRQDAIAFAESKAEWIASTRERLARRQEEHPKITPDEVEHLRREAHAYIPARVESLAREHGFSYTALRISSAHTRWGSCSSRNSISISLFTMLLPHHLRDFIILHELCHTRHPNHSAAFHALLDSSLGGKEQELQQELRRYTIPYIVAPKG